MIRNSFDLQVTSQGHSDLILKLNPLQCPNKFSHLYDLTFR